MAKKGQIQKRYSTEYKVGVIIDMREHRLGYRETARKYGMSGSGSTVDLLKRWERIYLEEGIDGFMKERRGKNNTSGRRGRPPKLDRKVEEDLIAENQRLRMEIEYLKKLNALVQERIERECKKK